MNFIETITEAEKNATDMCVQAHEESKVILAGARTTQLQAIEHRNQELAEKRTARRDTQKDDLKATYREILSRGIAESENVKRTSNNKAHEAIAFIIKNL